MMSVDPCRGVAGAAIPEPVQLASGWAVRWLGMCGGGAIGAPPAAQAQTLDLMDEMAPSSRRSPIADHQRLGP